MKTIAAQGLRAIPMGEGSSERVTNAWVWAGRLGRHNAQRLVEKGPFVGGDKTPQV